MFSITGYFLEGSKVVGRKMTPQMSVAPSRPLATNTSGGRHPSATSAPMSPRSTSVTSEPSLARRSSETGARSTRDQVSTKYCMSPANAASWLASAGVSGVSSDPSNPMR